MIPIRSSIARGACTALAIGLGLACGGGAEATGTDNGGNTGPQPTHPSGVLGAKISPVLGGPMDIAVSSTGTAYLTQYYGTGLARFQVDAPVATTPPIDLGYQPVDVAFNGDGTRAYALASRFLYDVDVASGTVSGTRDLGGGSNAVAISPNGATLFVAGTKSNMWVMPAASASVPAPVAVPTTIGSLALSPSGSSIYAANLYSTVYRLDPVTLAVQATSRSLSNFLGDVAVSPDGKEVYAVSDFGDLWILDATTLDVLGAVDVGSGAADIAVTPDGAQLYVSSYFGQLTIVDRKARTVTKSLDLGGTPHEIAFDKLGTRAFVANEYEWVDVIK